MGDRPPRHSSPASRSRPPGSITLSVRKIPNLDVNRLIRALLRFRLKEAAGREKDQLALNELYELETMGAERGEVIEQPVREASSDVSDDT